MTRSPYRRFTWFCVSIAVIAFAVGIAGSTHDRGMEAHEIFVAQTSRQMLAANNGAGDWVRPTFNDHARLNKPPLMYWAVMTAAKTLPGAANVDPWVARLPSAFASGIMALCTVLLGRTLFNASVGLLAAGFGVGSLGWIGYANNARPEMLYAACSVAMLTCFVVVWKRTASAGRVERSASDNRIDWLIALTGWFAGGLAIMAKGPQIPLLLVLGFVVFALVERKPRGLMKLRPQLGLPLMLLVPLPWVLAVLASEPGGWQAWTRDLFAGRGVTKVAFTDYLKPYYLYALPGLLLPWAVLLPLGIFGAIWKGNRRIQSRWGARLMVCLLIVPAIVMSFTIHRRDYYMLALMPPMAVLIAAAVWSWRGGLQRTDKQRRGWLIALYALIAVGGTALAASPAMWSDRRDRTNAFAREAAAAASKEIGPDAQVFAWGSDSTFLVYARNKPVPEITQIDQLVQRLGAALQASPVGVLTTRKSWQQALDNPAARPITGVKWQIISEHKGKGNDQDESAVLLKIEPAPVPPTP